MKVSNANMFLRQTTEALPLTHVFNDSLTHERIIMAALLAELPDESAKEITGKVCERLKKLFP